MPSQSGWTTLCGQPWGCAQYCFRCIWVGEGFALPSREVEPAGRVRDSWLQTSALNTEHRPRVHTRNDRDTGAAQRGPTPKRTMTRHPQHDAKGKIELDAAASCRELTSFEPDLFWRFPKLLKSKLMWRTEDVYHTDSDFECFVVRVY